MNISQRFIGRPFVFALAASLMFAAADAGATIVSGNVDVNATNSPISVTQGSTGTFGVTFDFDFGAVGSSSAIDTACISAGTCVSSFQFDLVFDNTQLVFVPTATTTPLGTDAALSAVIGDSFGVNSSNNGNSTDVAAVWLGIVTPYLGLTGHVDVTYMFQLASGATVGPTNVTASLTSYSDSLINPYGNPAAYDTATVNVTSTVVPLPATWLLMATGLGMFAIISRRRGSISS